MSPTCYAHVIRTHVLGISYPMYIRLVGRLLPLLRPRLAGAYSYRQLSLLLADSILPKCASCGITLQTSKPGQHGFYHPPSKRGDEPKSVTTKPRKPADDAYDRLLGGLSVEDRKLLLNSEDPTSQEDVAEIGTERPQNDRPLSTTRVECKRCRDATNHSVVDAQELTTETVARTMTEFVVPGSPVYYVVSAMDFPMSIDPLVFAFRRDVMVVVTKCDLLYKTWHEASTKSAFFGDYMWRKHGIPCQNTFVVSAKRGWGIEPFFDNLANNSYFIGSVNSGKSSLVTLLMHAALVQRGRLPNARQKRKTEKQVASLGYNQAKKLHAQQIERWKRENGPGTSYLPGYTRAVIPFVLDNKTVVHDVPGFALDKSLVPAVKPQLFRTLLKGVPVYDKGLYNLKYSVVKETQVVTVGGLLFIEVPQHTMLQIKNLINHKTHVFKTMEKAIDVMRHPEKYPALPDAFAVTPEVKLKRYIIPSFYGSVDLVVRYLGYINITPTGAKHEDLSPLVVYLPEQVEAVIRQPITKYVTTTLTGRDARGNKLTKQKLKKLSTKLVQQYTGKTPFFSLLIPYPDSGGHAATPSDAMQEYVARIKAQVVPHADVDEETRYANWI